MEINSDIDGSDKIDPLLNALVFLTKHYGRTKSQTAIVAGLAYDQRKMGPTLFCEAADRIGLKSSIVQRKKINKIPKAVLPAVIMLEDDQAVILLKRYNKMIEVFDPRSGKISEQPEDGFQKKYIGYAIFLQPTAAFKNPDDHHKNGHDEVENNAEKHWFWSVVNDNKSTYTLALLGAVFINLFALTSPLFIMNVYDRVIPNNAIETGWALGIGALAIFIFDFIMRTLRSYLIDLAGRRIDVISGQKIYDQVLDMKISGRPKSSGVFANMLRDFDTVRDFFTSITITTLVDLPFTLFFLFIIYQIGGGLALILCGLIFAVFIIGMTLQIPLKNVVRKSTKSAEAKHGLLIETIHALETIKSIGADGLFRARYSDYLGESAAYGQQSRFISGLGVNAATLLQQSASIIVVLAGMYLVRDGDLSMGGLIACVILGGRAIAPIGQIANLMTRYHQAGGALKTLESVMNKPTERPSGKDFLHRSDLQGKIKFDTVSFAYPDVDRKVLDNVSFSINPGERIGIIGRIGSGKSTIARLLMGLYDCDEGAILLDDTDYRQIDPADIRRSTSYISQDVVLFRGSVRDNITASAIHASEDEILNAAKISGVHDFIARHPMGYDAPVGEHGAGLSGGQRQAIAFARTMLSEPKILICDEPTNAMDMETEKKFMTYIQQDLKDKTLILITHKNGLLPYVDRLILMDQGKVILDGPRDQVIMALQGGEVRVPE